MSRKGGYQILDFKEKDLTGEQGAIIEGIYNSAKEGFINKKRVVISGCKVKNLFPAITNNYTMNDFIADNVIYDNNNGDINIVVNIEGNLYRIQITTSDKVTCGEY